MLLEGFTVLADHKAVRGQHILLQRDPRYATAYILRIHLQHDTPLNQLVRDPASYCVRYSETPPNIQEYAPCILGYKYIGAGEIHRINPDREYPYFKEINKRLYIGVSAMRRELEPSLLSLFIHLLE